MPHYYTLSPYSQSSYMSSTSSYSHNSQSSFSPMSSPYTPSSQTSEQYEKDNVFQFPSTIQDQYIVNKSITLNLILS